MNSLGLSPEALEARHRFEAFVMPEPNSGCWLWMGSVISEKRGYGRFVIPGLTRLAHRAAYLIYRGDLPVDLQVDHKCRNTFCVNPDHLEVVTAAENLRRSRESRNLINFCGKGHSMADALSEVAYKNGHRVVVRRCRTCAQERNRASYRRRMAK